MRICDDLWKWSWPQMTHWVIQATKDPIRLTRGRVSLDVAGVELYRKTHRTPRMAVRIEAPRSTIWPAWEPLLDETAPCLTLQYGDMWGLQLWLMLQEPPSIELGYHRSWNSDQVVSPPLTLLCWVQTRLQSWTERDCSLAERPYCVTAGKENRY